VAASFGLAVAAFRNGSATLAAAREAEIIGDDASIWASQLAQKREPAPVPTRLSA